MLAIRLLHNTSWIKYQRAVEPASNEPHSTSSTKTVPTDLRLDFSSGSTPQFIKCSSSSLPKREHSCKWIRNGPFSTPFNFQLFFPEPNPLLHKRGRKTEPPLQHTNFIVWQLQGQHWLCCWCHKQRRWRAVDPAAPGKTVGWKASVLRLGIPWSHLKPWYEGAGYCRVWICVDIEIWWLKTSSWSHHGAEKHDNLLSSHVDTFKGSFNSSVPQSVVTRPNGPHQVLAASSNFPTPQAPSWSWVLV